MTQRGDVDKLITTWLQSDADGNALQPTSTRAPERM